MLTLSDVMHFFTDKFAGLCRRLFTRALLLHGSSDCVSFRHMDFAFPEYYDEKPRQRIVEII